MATRNRRIGAVTAALLWAAIELPGMAACAQQPAPQPGAPQRDDPATSGAGPTSGAPGQMEHEPRKGEAPTTTDGRGVTTTHPGQDDRKADKAPADSGNESAGTAAPEPRR
jgi:hypothetical protein